MEAFTDFDRNLMKALKPSDYFNEIDKTGLFDSVYPYTLLGTLKKIPQSPVFHPEGNVWNHTMLVVDRAAEKREESRDSRVLMWSALLHDLGKAPTTKLKKGRIISYDHDIEGEKLASDFLREFSDDLDFIFKVSKMVRWHMQILHVVKGLPYANINQMVKEVEIKELALLGLCDRLGRGGLTKEKIIEEERNIKIFLDKCQEYSYR